MLLRVLLAGLAVVVIGTGIGVSAYALRQATGQRDTITLANSTATLMPTPRPQPTPGPDPRVQAPGPTVGMGTTARLPGIGDYGYSLIWVNRTGLWAWDRAYDERDDKAMSRIINLYETLKVPDRTLVRVVAVDGDTTQVEVLEGALLGRRGWTHSRNLAPQ